MKLSIIICTYNRHNLLELVIRRCLALIKDKDLIELLIIDNNSTDSTETVVGTINSDNLRYVKETQQGLSYARNRGVQESQGEWVFFLDDDGFPDPDLFDRIMYHLNQGKYKVIGGHYYPWYVNGEQIWSKAHYYSNHYGVNEETVFNDGRKLSGGIFLVKKTLFSEFGLFDTNYGMKGNTIGYDEEVELQDRFLKNGIKLFYDPSMKMAHAVAKQKLSVNWFFKAKKAKANAMFLRYPEKHFKYLILAPLIFIGQFGYLSFSNLFLLFKKNYYCQNYIVESFGRPYKWYCVWVLILSKHLK